MAEIAHIDLSALGDLTTGKVPRRAPPTRPVSGKGQGGPSSVRQAIRFLLHRPSLVKLLEGAPLLEDLDQPGMPLLRQLVEYLRKNPHVTCGTIVEHWRGEDAGKHLAKLATQPLMVPEDGLETEFLDLVAKLASHHQDQLVDGLISKARLGDLSEQEKKQLQQALASRDGGSH